MKIAFSNARISTRIMLGFFLVLAALIGVGAYAYFNLADLVKIQHDFSRRSNNVEMALKAENGFVDLRREAVLLSWQGGNMDRINAKKDELLKNIDTLKSSIKDPKRRKMAEDFGESVKIYAKGLDEIEANRGNAEKVQEILKKNGSIGEKALRELEDMSREIVAVNEKTEKALDEKAGHAINMIMAVTLLALLAGLGVAFAIGRGISVPVQRLTGVMRRLADGDLDVDIPDTTRGDEVGTMGRTVEVFKENAKKVETMRAQQAEMEARAAKERKEALHKMASDFEARVMDVVRGVSASATEMQATARSMSQIAQETSSQATTVAAAATQASTNVETVSAAAEELSSSTSEIGSRVSEAARMSQNAAQESARTNEMVGRLAAAAAKIGEVVNLINEIAAQTNLLALNATIEAARAGEAGKGFAVVASEVKGLANQTSKATEEISAQISAVQSETNNAVGAIKSIGDIIEQVREISAGIAAAVEQQSAATKEIARNVSQAAQGTHDVSANIATVTEASAQTGAAAEQVLSSSSELAQNAEKLRHEVEDFLSTVRRG